ncbi:MAG: plastocyanin/azurin family copper-binding protein, partial [Halobacteriaceae archaeon]
RLESGRSTTHTFESAGAYEYYCTIHGKATMCGVVVVGGASYDGTLPCQDSDTTTTSGDDGGYY